MYTVCLTLEGPLNHKLRRTIKLQFSNLGRLFVQPSMDFINLISRAITFGAFLTPPAEEISLSYVIRSIMTDLHYSFKSQSKLESMISSTSITRSLPFLLIAL